MKRGERGQAGNGEERTLERVSAMSVFFLRWR